MLLEQIIPALQLSIGPVILISGAGLVLLSMTNRYARVIDRARILAETLRQNSQGNNQRIKAQIQIIAQRARKLRLAIAFVSTSLLLAAVLVISLFLIALLDLQAVAIIIALFVLSMCALSIGLIVFIQDVNHSMAALKIELGDD
jgi:Cu/Ag efflux pump CusA